MENSPTRDTDHVVKFNGKNFPLWKFGCWLKLEQHNLVTIVNGTEPLLEPLPEQVQTFFFTCHVFADVGDFLR